MGNKKPTIKELAGHIGQLYQRQDELLRLIKTNSQALYNYINFKKDLKKFNDEMQGEIDKLKAMNDKEKGINLKKEAENEPKKEKKD